MPGGFVTSVVRVGDTVRRSSGIVLTTGEATLGCGAPFRANLSS